jgi:hypothetical protein
MHRFNCYHRRTATPACPAPKGMWNGSVYANSPREALGKFKRLTPTARSWMVIDARAEGETR